MTPDDFEQVGTLAHRRLRDLLGEDWSEPAGDLDWTCRQTLDHVIDCVFSYALQLAARAASGLGLHTYDIAVGLNAAWQVPDDLCRAITASEALWMFDRQVAAASADPWTSLLVGSGRTPRG